MKIRDLIAKMHDNTEIFIYSEYHSCLMPSYGDCRGEETADGICENCEHYIDEINEVKIYHGIAGECPIKVAELAIQEINCKPHRVKVTQRKWGDVPMFAIKVKDE